MTTPDNTNVITVGDLSYDLSTPLGCLNYVKAMDAVTNGLMADDIRQMLTAQPILKWSDEQLANTLKERVKANAKAILKDATKIDHCARFIETTVFKFNDKKIDHAKIMNVIDGYLASLNVGITAYNTANESANLEPFRLVGGKAKGKSGGKGHGRSYRVLADLLVKHADLWQGKTQIIEYGARSLAYPIHVENDQTMIMYTGTSADQFIDTRDKDEKKDQHAIGKLAYAADGKTILGRWRKCDLVNGKLYPIGMINTLNTWANGSAMADGVNRPTAGPNSWKVCVLDGLTIPDGLHKTNKIANPTLETFYDQYKPADQDDGDQDDTDQDDTE